MDNRKLIVGNWKMNLGIPESIALAKSIVETAEKTARVKVVLCPSFTALYEVGKILSPSVVSLGAQNVFWENKGAFTGQVSPWMLSDVGCQYCIVGHSESRGRFGSYQDFVDLIDYFSDTDKTVNRKVLSLLHSNIHPIVCVGETNAERDIGQTDIIIERQLSSGLINIDINNADQICVAYEPVWAIGTGMVCDAVEANRVCALIKDRLAGLFSSNVSERIYVLYGGSVTESNSRDLLLQPFINGLLVGGASLQQEQFSRILLSA